MINAWNLQELRESIAINQPKEKTPLIEITNSLGRSREIFEYHKRLARDAFGAFDTTNDPTGIIFFEHLCGASEQEELLYDANLASEANLIACISVTRNVFDSFGQLLNGLVVGHPRKGNLYIHDIINLLPPSELKDELGKAISSTWYEYINAFMNTVKHRQLIKHNPSISFIDNRHGGKVDGFRYKDKPYSERWAMDVLQGTVDLQNSLGACGRALNRHYVNRSSE
ncbi:hypothetical protein K5D68_13880 [Pseudomonas cichorii]|nr:hypothetical protein [Pseudomonas cichorii]MBX8550684.1 hypothetical protein [Pseudomonas cichorii]MBX8586447.1 hypothetical protein [Pseudomonas cichorii]MBX8601429.1 hypothetical protein [Pseudomonas cichorii]